jgi:Fe-S-cluster-containing dehydrogenase component
MKCDMCYDRTSEGKKPMCATVCPSGALFFGTRAEIDRLRPQSRPTNRFRFGGQTISTKVNVMLPRSGPPPILDVTAAMNETTSPRSVRLNLLDDALYQPEGVA